MKTVLFLTLVLCLSANAYSAVRTWDGGGADANWTTAANWVGDVAPAANDDLVFPEAAAQFSTNNNFFLLTNFNSISIQGGSYTIGGNPFRLAGGLTVGGGTQTFNTSVTLNGTQTFTLGQGSVTTLAVLTLGSHGLTVSGDGSIAIGLISGSGTITKNGLGAGLIAAASSYNGAINVLGGVFVVDAGIPNSPVTINTAATGGEFGFSGFGGTGTVGTVTVTQGVISAGTVTSPTGVLNTGSITFTAEGTYLAKIGGATPGTDGHDQLSVTGTVALNNARLAPLPWGSYRPTVGDSFVIIRNDGTDPVSGTFLNAPEGAVFSGPLNSAYKISYQGGDGNDVVITAVSRAIVDFDGDGRTDISIFRPSVGEWWYQRSSDGQVPAGQFGSGSDQIAPVDFTGDGRTDIAFWRPSTGEWFVLRSENGTYFSFPFGAAGDIPAPADYDGDARADAAVFRPSSATWFVLRSSDGGVTIQQFGANGDLPVVNDYDGDGRADIAIYRRSVGEWWIQRSFDLSVYAFQFGTSTDRAVPGDYTGDGRTDAALFRPSTGEWFILRSEDSSYFSFPFGMLGDIPAPGDYDGDGRHDAAVFRPSASTWYVQRTTAGTAIQQFGAPGDIPGPSAFVR